jgi:hypothetical protein
MGRLGAMGTMGRMGNMGHVGTKGHMGTRGSMSSMAVVAGIGTMSSSAMGSGVVATGVAASTERSQPSATPRGSCSVTRPSGTGQSRRAGSQRPARGVPCTTRRLPNRSGRANSSAVLHRAR